MEAQHMSEASKDKQVEIKVWRRTLFLEENDGEDQDEAQTQEKVDGQEEDQGHEEVQEEQDEDQEDEGQVIWLEDEEWKKCRQ